MVPVAAILPWLSSIWLKSKWVIVIAVFLGWSLVCYTAGQKSVYKELVKQESKAVQAERRKGTQAVQRAASDVARIKDLEKANDELTKRLDAVPDRVLCPIDDDSLRLLEEVRKSTERE
jgi:hypothetical protein